MNEHLELDQLADLLAGDDSGRPHLTGCESCLAALARLEQSLPAVTSALAELPLPAQPADLEDRLARALRPAPVADLAQRRAARWNKPLAAVSSIAAVAALVFGGMVVLDNDNARDGDSQAAANSAESATKTSNTGAAYRKDGKLLAQQLPALLSGTAAAAQDRANAPEAGILSSPPPAAGTAGGKVADPLDRLRTTEGLASCITALTEPGQVVLPLALDYATFEANPALVVVLPSSKAGKVEVWVVGPTCTAADAALLYFTRLDRP